MKLADDVEEILKNSFPKGLSKNDILLEIDDSDCKKLKSNFIKVMTKLKLHDCVTQEMIGYDRFTDKPVYEYKYKEGEQWT